MSYIILKFNLNDSAIIMTMMTITAAGHHHHHHVTATDVHHCLTALQKHHILETGSDLLTNIMPNTVNIPLPPHLRAEIVPIYKSSIFRMLHFNQTMDEDQMKWQDTGNRF